ncbi:hypothetical protein [Thermogutta sp.]|uniref:hypothetical protein n=1 Tax=Thermogutta sp. TaxID=1962930 RepID=UPI003C7A88C6
MCPTQVFQSLFVPTCTHQSNRADLNKAVVSGGMDSPLRHWTLRCWLWNLAVALLVQWCANNDVLGSNHQSADKAPLPQPIVRAGSEAGPTVLIVAGIHGNEPAGVRAAQIIARWSIARGKLVVLSPANPPAIGRRQRTIPGAPPEEADLNRNFLVEGHECRPRGVLAREIWQHVEQIRPDWLVDLHESLRFHKDGGVGNTVIVYPRDETVSVTRKILDKINEEIAEEEEKFVVLRWPARGSLARAAGAILDCHSVLVESTRKDPVTKRVAHHCHFVLALLEELQMGPTQGDS